MNIKKRNGEIVPFMQEKIVRAVEKALIETNEVESRLFKSQAEITTMFVLLSLEKNKLETPSVEDVQDFVEDALMQIGLPKTAKAYILYRDQHKRARSKKEELFDVLNNKFNDVTSKGKDSVVTKGDSGNANVDTEGPMGKMLSYGAETSKMFALEEMVSKKFAEAHKNGDIHIHDLDFLPTKTLTCCQIDLSKLFKNGFSTGHGFLREPNSIGSYAALAAIAIQANQNDQHGGQSIPAFDHYMAPGVKKTFLKGLRKNIKNSLEDRCDCNCDDTVDEVIDSMIQNEVDFILAEPNNQTSEEIAKRLQEKIIGDSINISNAVYFAYKRAMEESDKATYQAMEGFVHNLNTMHSRAGAQTPFSSINYGTDTSEEGRMVIKNLLLATEAGLGNGETPIFPIQIFKLKEGVNYNKEDPNYDLFELACKVSAKRLFPNFSFLDSPFNAQYYIPNRPETEATYMGCRTRVIGNVCGEETVTGRGNLSFTSINLPRLAIKAKEMFPDDRDEDFRIREFKESLLKMMKLVKAQLIERMEIQKTATKENFSFLMGEGIWRGSDNLAPGEQLGDVLKQGTISIGFIGLAETLKCLIGEHHGESKRAQELGLEIISMMRRYCDEESRITNLNITLLATPAEGLCLSGDTVVQTPFGHKKIKDVKAGDLLFSYNLKTREIELDTVERSWMTSPSRKVMKITFDTGQEVVCTPNHPFAVRKITRDEKGRIITVGGYNESIEFVKAENLKIGNRIKSNYLEKSPSGYLRFKNTKKYVHRMIYEHYNGEIPEGYVVHHKDEDKDNLAVENLELLSSKSHRILHMKDTIKPFCYTSGSQKGAKNSFYGKHHSEETKSEISKKKKGQKAWNFIDPNEVATSYMNGMGIDDLVRKFHSTPHTMKSKLNEAGISLEANHVIVDIEYLEEEIPVYDITMTNNSNFFIGGNRGILVHNSGRFVRMDRERYGEIKGVTDKEWHTNSFHVPVEYKLTAFDKIKIEAPYHALTNAGHISYIELDGDPAKNLDAFKAVVAAEKEAGMGYAAINHPVDRDPICGYVGVIDNQCPCCGRKEVDDGIPFERIRRITGYLVGTMDKWNSGKAAEEAHRVKHMVKDRI